MDFSKDISEKDIGNGILMVGDSKFVSSKAVSLNKDKMSNFVLRTYGLSIGLFAFSIAGIILIKVLHLPEVLSIVVLGSAVFGALGIFKSFDADMPTNSHEEIENYLPEEEYFEDKKAICALLENPKAYDVIDLGTFSAGKLNYSDEFVELDPYMELNFDCKKIKCEQCDPDNNIRMSYGKFINGLSDDIYSKIISSGGKYHVSRHFVQDADGARLEELVTESSVSLWDENMDSLEKMTTSYKA